ncbi:BCCT family transporter [Nitrospinaceae bacterium]|nr:BCCT family transporter [Nitrospinaceae bacterium]
MESKIKIQQVLFFKRTNPPVFIISALIMLGFILMATLFGESSKKIFDSVQSTIVKDFSWVFTISTIMFLIFIFFLLFSRFGRIRLGQPDDKPEFGYTTWFAMMFSAGMGIGLVFWSIAEPIKHFTNPPSIDSQLPPANLAMGITYFHWGLHAWSVFIVVGLSLAYFSYRKGLPLTIRSCFYPLLGNKIYGPWGHAIDIFAVVGTMFGVATSLGLGAMQVNSGLNFLGDCPENKMTQIVLIVLITACATVSVVLGLEKGISRLSYFNICLSIILIAFLFFLGPTMFILQTFGNGVKDYVSNIFYFSYWSEWIAKPRWQSSWTIFYWGWWIAWAPFVGMFIARISKGRTLREFIIGGFFAPVFATFIWLSVFGGTALYLEIFEGAPISQAVSANVSTALFETLAYLPMEKITAALSTLVIVTFFVTSSDSGSLVIDILTAGGDQNPPANQRVFWAVTEGVIASVLLLAGGLQALQTAAIASGLPFALIMIGMCFALFKELRNEP